VLRSKTPDGVHQELWAYLLVHYALRALMHDTAVDHELDPDRLSFTATLRIVRRHTITRAVFPLTDSPWPSAWPSPRSSPNGCPHADCEPSPGWSRARCATTTSNAPTIVAGHTPPDHPTMPWSSNPHQQTDRHCD
jgi:hypothetical protein